MIRPVDRSKLGLRENAILGNYSLSKAHHASLDIGTDDALFIWDIVLAADNAGTNYVLDKVFNVPPWNGYGFMLTDSKMRFYWQDAGGGSTSYTPPIQMTRGRHLLAFFLDRSGNLYQYDNGALIYTADISAYDGVDKGSPGGAFRVLQDTVFPSQPLLGLQLHFFTAGQLPDATERAQIASSLVANPYDMPEILSGRTLHATELRLHITFDDLDPSAVAITDESAYGNDLTITGATVADCVKEFYGV